MLLLCGNTSMKSNDGSMEGTRKKSRFQKQEQEEDEKRAGIN